MVSIVEYLMAGGKATDDASRTIVLACKATKATGNLNHTLNLLKSAEHDLIHALRMVREAIELIEK